MNNLYVYGCSASYYVPGPKGDFNHGWAGIVSKTLNLKENNRAVSGGSTENALSQFTRDFENNLFSANDLIIFQVTTPGRLFFNYQKQYPETASRFFWPDISKPSFKKDPLNQWYHDNKDYIEWYLVNMDWNLTQHFHESSKHVLRSVAESYPAIKIIVLQVVRPKVYFPFGSNLDNFYNPSIYLSEIWDKEMKNHKGKTSADLYNEWIRHTDWDTRANHLSKPNLFKLSELICDFYLNGNKRTQFEDYFIESIFDPIKNVDDYYKYVEQGLLEHIRIDLKK